MYSNNLIPNPNPSTINNINNNHFLRSTQYKEKQLDALIWLIGEK